MGIPTRRVGSPEPFSALPAGEEASTCFRENWATVSESALSSPTKKLISLRHKLRNREELPELAVSSPTKKPISLPHDPRSRQDEQIEEEVSSPGFAHSDDGVDAHRFSTSPGRKESPKHVVSLAEDSVGSEVGSDIDTSELVDSEDRTSACSDFTLPRASFPEESVVSSPTKKLISLPDKLCCRFRVCLGCNKIKLLEDSASLCNKCIGSLKIALLEARKSYLATARFYCLQCRALSQGKHGGHNSDCIPLDVFHGYQVAWVTKKEKWAVIFDGVQSRRHQNTIHGRPFPLHTPQGHWCQQCHDHLSEDRLFGTLILFCSIECWVGSDEAAAEYNWVNELLHTDFEQLGVPYDAFCTTCLCAFRTAEDGAEHQHKNKHLSVVTHFENGTAATKVEIPTDHFMAGPWKFIKDLAGGETLSSPKHQFRLRDEGAQRCRRCNTRLEDGGGDTCSLECALDHLMLPRSLKNPGQVAQGITSC